LAGTSFGLVLNRHTAPQTPAGRHLLVGSSPFLPEPQTPQNSNVCKKLKTTKEERDRWQSRYLELLKMTREEFIECDRQSMADKGFDA
jgi:hypothetical protein